MADTSSTIRQPAIRALMALMAILAALAAAVAVCDATALAHLSEPNAHRLAGIIGRAHMSYGHTDVLGLAATMRQTVASSIVFAVLAVAYALLTVRVTRLAMHRGRIIIWLGALVVGIAQLVWIAAESSTVFDSAQHALAPAELRQAGAAEAYANLLPGWYAAAYYLFEVALVVILAVTSMLLLRPGVGTYYLSTNRLRDPLT
ncbi:MAG TPA: hypothetical protein VGN37_13430 [Actinocatenispora sp.]